MASFDWNKPSAPQFRAQHVDGVLERRNRALRVLYDTLVAIEDVPEEQVSDVLCESLRQVCRAERAVLVIFNDRDGETVSLREAVLAVGHDRHEQTVRPLQTIREAPIPPWVSEDLSRESLRRCQTCDDCPLRSLGIPIDSQVECDERHESCYRLSCVREGQLVAVALVHMADESQLQTRDVVETYLSLAGTIIQRNVSLQTLRESREFYRSLVEATEGGHIVTDPSGLVIEANPRFAEMVGVTETGELIGRPLSRWVVSSDRDKISRALQGENRQRRIRGLEVQLQRPDGKHVPIEINGTQIALHGSMCVMALCTDLTRRRTIESQLHQAQKLEAVGQLASGIAHEINTPCQFVGDNIRFLEEGFQEVKGVLEMLNSLPRGPRQPGQAERILDELIHALDEIEMDYLLREVPTAMAQSTEGMQRISHIVQAMKNFSQPTLNTKVKIDLNKAIESTITVARNEWRYVADVVFRPDHDLPPVPCLPGEINQVFLHLVMNAAQAIGEVVQEGQPKGSIVIETHLRDRCVEVRVSDDGPGIAPEHQDKVLDPFFTTKEVGKGTGQGLAVSRSIITGEHHGTLTFETQPGVGTTFIVRLPLEADAPPTLSEVFPEETSHE
jgi:PAS domain S-box-containing protein